MVGFAVWIGDHFLTVISQTSRPRPRGHLSSSHGGESLREEKSAFFTKIREIQKDPREIGGRTQSKEWMGWKAGSFFGTRDVVGCNGGSMISQSSESG
jgi:hypothetical protein